MTAIVARDPRTVGIQEESDGAEGGAQAGTQTDATAASSTDLIPFDASPPFD